MMRLTTVLLPDTTRHVHQVVLDALHAAQTPMLVVDPVCRWAPAHVIIASPVDDVKRSDELSIAFTTSATDLVVFFNAFCRQDPPELYAALAVAPVMVVMQAGSVDVSIIAKTTEVLYVPHGTLLRFDLPPRLPLRYYLKDALYLKDDVTFR